MGAQTYNNWVIWGNLNFKIGMAKKLKELLEQHGLMKKMIFYVKDEGANLNVLTIILKSIVNCEALDVTESL